MLVLLVLIITIVILLYQKEKKKERKTKEGFQAQPVGDFPAALYDTVYAKHGVEKCSILDNGSIPSAAFLDTLRFRKWKPSSRAENTDTNAEYCYYYSDRDAQKRLYRGDPENRSLANIGDPLSSTNDAGIDSCSSNSPLFGKASFVTDVFKDNDVERTVHDSLRYEKCVFKIDANRVTPSALTTFWDELDTTKSNSLACNGQLQALKAEQNNYLGRIAELVQETNLIRQQLQRLRDEERIFKQNNNYVPTLTYQTLQQYCTACSNNIVQSNQTFQTESNQYNIDLQEIAQYRLIKQTSIAAKKKLLQLLVTDINVLDNEIQDQEVLLTLAKNSEMELYTKRSIAKENYESCAKRKAELQDQNKTFQTQKDTNIQISNNAQNTFFKFESINTEIDQDIQSKETNKSNLEKNVDAISNKLLQCTAMMTAQQEERNNLSTDTIAKTRELTVCNQQVEFYKEEIRRLNGNTNFIAQSTDRKEEKITDITVATAADIVKIRQDFTMKTRDLSLRKCEVEANLKEELIKLRQQANAPRKCEDIKPLCCSVIFK